MYISQAECFVQETKHRTVTRLQKDLFGIQEENRASNYVLCTIVAAIRFIKSDYDGFFHIRPEDDFGLTIILSYVIDMLILAKDDKELRRVVTGIEKHLEI